MKILLVVTGLTMGGAEKVVTRLADAMAKRGHRVVLAYLKGPLQVRPAHPEVTLVFLGMESVAGAISGWWKFRALLQRFKPDIVHSHMFHAAMLARLTRLTTRMRCIGISTMHTSFAGGPFRTLAYRLTEGLADISTNVSREAVDALVADGAVKADRMITVYNGIEVDEFQAAPAARAVLREKFLTSTECKLLVSAGRLSWSKDYPNMFKALSLLRDRVRFKLLIAGDGPLRSELEALAKDLGLQADVEFLGIRSDIPNLMSAADVFVLSSAGESFGLVVAEAMACECVVVATDSGGVREVLGDAGFLVPTRDPDALASSLLAAVSLGQDEATRLGKKARQRVVDIYSFDRSMETWDELYSTMVAAR